MGPMSKGFTIVLLLTALDVLVVRNNGVVVWRVWGGEPWIRFCLLLLAGVGAFTLSDVWAHSFSTAATICEERPYELQQQTKSAEQWRVPMLDSLTDLSGKLAAMLIWITGPPTR